MKKACVFFLALASMTNATDIAIHCGQKGFQVSAQLGCAQTTSSNESRNFTDFPIITAGMNAENITRLASELSLPSGIHTFDVSGMVLDYKDHLASFKPSWFVAAGLSLGYKWILNCNQYSVTPNIFFQYNNPCLYAGLLAHRENFKTVATYDQTKPEDETLIVVGPVASTETFAGGVKLSSNAIFGFNGLFAKEFNWGSSGLLLGMKFNQYKMEYLTTKPADASPYVSNSGFTVVALDNIPIEPNLSLNIKDYIETDKVNQMAIGFTIGFSMNFYISNNVSSGLTLFYDMYTPVTFKLNGVAISPYTSTEQGQKIIDGQLKLQHNTIGFLMNLTYSFG